MIIWRGYGFLVAVIGLAALVLTEKISEHITGDDRFYQQHGWVVLIGMLIAAALTYGFHRLLLREKERVLIDKQTGQEIVLPADHSLFFVPVKLWPVIFVAIGLIFAIVGPRANAEPGRAANEASQTTRP
ncbi:MAG: hypothetical protein AB7G28_20285 [Pirellulales bacterium]